MIVLLAVSAASAVGATARYLLDKAVASRQASTPAILLWTARSVDVTRRARLEVTPA